MAELDRYIPGVPCWIDTTQPDPDAAASFYAGLFGWELENAMPAGEPASTSTRASAAAMWRRSARSGRARRRTAVWNTYIWVENADETAAKAREAGGSDVREPWTWRKPAGWRGSRIPKVPFSRLAAERHNGAPVVNEPELQLQRPPKPDEETQRRSTARSSAGSSWQMGMWALPAYGDHLEALNPGTTERTRRDGRADPLRGGRRGILRVERQRGAALGRHVRGRRCGRKRRARGGAGRDGAGAAVRATWIRGPSFATPAARRQREPVKPENKDMATRKPTCSRGHKGSLRDPGQPLARASSGRPAREEQVEALEARQHPEDVVGLLRG